MSSEEVLLFSGGIDSFVAYYYLRKYLPQGIKTVYFDLGAPYNHREKEAVLELLPETIIDNSLSVGETQRGVNAFIPYRNLLLACLARKYGKSIWIAGLHDDCVEDKTPGAFAKMQDCMNFISKKEDSCMLNSPFWRKTKEQVVRWWKEHCQEFNVPQEKILDTISCYNSSEQTRYCGRCPSCLRKFFALRSNGYKLEFYDQKLFDEYVRRARNGVYQATRNQTILSLEGYICKKIYSIDIDGILTNEIFGCDYDNRTVNLKNVDFINNLSEEGNRINLFTSRFGTEEDKKITENWLKKNGVRYDSILFGKPYCDFNIDDKNLIIGE